MFWPLSDSTSGFDFQRGVSHWRAVVTIALKCIIFAPGTQDTYKQMAGWTDGWTDKWTDSSYD